ncbi:MAG: DUF4870 domain-containing protein [Chloroflexota bacterium]
MTEQPMNPELTSDDKLWAMLGYMPFIGWIIAIVALIMEDKRARPFIKFHSIQSLILGVLNGVISGALSVVIIGACTGVAIMIYMIYLGIKAYQGETVNVPFLTDFIKNQGWA